MRPNFKCIICGAEIYFGNGDQDKHKYNFCSHCKVNRIFVKKPEQPLALGEWQFIDPDNFDGED